MTSTMAGSVVAAASSSTLVSALASPARAASPVGDVVGKITVGYQGWFACIGDGSPINALVALEPELGPAARRPATPDHRAPGRTCASTPAATRPRTRTSATASRRRCSPPTTSRRSTPTSCGCSRTAATPPRCSGSTRPAARARPATRWRPRCAARPRRTGRKFYIMYDVTGWTNMQSEIKTDWTDQDVGATPPRRRTPGRTASRSSCIWGFGFNDANHPFSAGRLPRRHQLVQGPGLLRDRRGADASGAPASNDSRRRVPRRLPRVQHDLAVDGRADRRRRPAPTRSTTTSTSRDQADCNANGIDYQPCVLPGDLSGAPARARRLHVAAVLQHGPGRRCRASTSRCSTSTTRATRSPRPPRRRRRCPTNSGLLRARRGRHGLLLGLLPAPDRRRRPDAQGPDRADRRPGRPSRSSAAAAGHRTWRPAGRPRRAATSRTSGRAMRSTATRARYWESANNAFPQWIAGRPGRAATVGRIVLAAARRRGATRRRRCRCRAAPTARPSARSATRPPAPSTRRRATR